MAFLIKAIFLSTLIATIWADAHIFLKFIYFENPLGVDMRKECCDHSIGKLFCKEKGCDHMFTICMDKRSESDCTLGRIQTAAIIDQDATIFGDKVANLSNPMRFHINGPLPSVVDMSVRVVDDDPEKGRGKHDYIDTLKQRVEPMPREPKRFKVTHPERSELEFEIWAKCLPGWTGTHCERKA